MPKKSGLDRLFSYWLLIVIVNSFLVLITDITNVVNIASFFKISLPFFLFYYLRRFIRSEKDIEGLLTTFIFSGIFVYSVFLYEIFVHPIEVQETRITLERIQGFYADVANYGMYTAMIYISVCYFYLKKETTFNQIRNLLIITVLAITILVRINHVSSYVVIGMLMIVFFYFNFRLKPVYGVLFGLVFVLAMAFTLKDILKESFDPLTQREMEVYNGTREEDQGFHGRIGRWKGMAEEWKKFNIVVKTFGVPWAFDNDNNWIYSAGSHNDYLRMQWTTGYAGLGLYILILINVIIKVFKQRKVDRYLGIATMTMLLLYSISLTPTFYPFFMYFVMIVWAYLAIPKKIIVRQVET